LICSDIVAQLLPYPLRNMKVQRTLKQSFTLRGIGLHSGKRASLVVRPAPANHGVCFVRTDLEGRPTVGAHVRNVISTTLATTIAEGSAKVSTVEHLMSALWAMGVDNALCEVDGEEVPILDGSALPFAEAIAKVGLKSQRASRRYLVAKETIELRSGDKWAVLRPAKDFSIRYTIDFPHPVINRQEFHFSHQTDFASEIAPCRTFGFLRDVERMQAMGLARGGSLKNAVVLDDQKALNPEGLRFEDEFVRHKVLDALGDFSLIGFPILAEIELHKAGHELQTKLIHELLERPHAFAIRVAQTSESSEEAFGLRPVLVNS
jgi:UDP-3-O-[3-hydroxymyristoyl] N-acetylglucosamine deacetylase